MSCSQQGAHIAIDFPLSMQPIAHQLGFDCSSSKYIHLWAGSFGQMLDHILSWVPAVQARLHHPPARK